MILFILSIWVLLILVLSFYNLKWGITSFLVYHILVPIPRLQIGSLELGANAIYLIFLISFIYYVNKKRIKVDIKPFWPFIIFYVGTLFEMPFQNGVDFGRMLYLWRASLQGTLVLPFVMWHLIKVDQTALRLFSNALIACIIISATYGIFLTTTGGVNPYIMMFLPYMDNVSYVNGLEYYLDYYSAEGGGRIFGRISSVFMHPMGFSLFLGFSLIYIYMTKSIKNSYYKFCLIVAIVYMIFVCGVRSIILSMFISVLSFLLMSRRIKYFFYSVFIGLIIYFFVSSSPVLLEYIGSISDTQNDVVKGSSLSMRLEQFYGAVKIASENPFWGLGYGWTGEYVANKGGHPVCLYFESLIYSTMCNFGIVGFIIWSILIIFYFKFHNTLPSKSSVVLNTILIVYISFACITGDYGYMKTFLLFYVLMLGDVCCTNTHGLYFNKKYNMYKFLRRYIYVRK